MSTIGNICLTTIDSWKYYTFNVLTIGNIIPDCHSKWNIVLEYGYINRNTFFACKFLGKYIRINKRNGDTHPIECDWYMLKLVLYF